MVLLLCTNGRYCQSGDNKDLRLLFKECLPYPIRKILVAFENAKLVDIFLNFIAPSIQFTTGITSNVILRDFPQSGNLNIQFSVVADLFYLLCCHTVTQRVFPRHLFGIHFHTGMMISGFQELLLLLLFISLFICILMQDVYWLSLET